MHCAWSCCSIRGPHQNTPAALLSWGCCLSACVDCCCRCLVPVVLVQHPDKDGDWQASTLGVAYDWTSGQLHSHKYLWQKATSPAETHSR